VEFVIEQNQFKLSNKGAAIVLKNKGNQTIDELVYGEAPSPNGWKGEPLLLPAKGVIIERKSEIDTNGRDDWKADRRIGQSSFELTKFNFDGNIIVFASPDSSYFILREEIKNASESIFLNLYKFINHGLAWEILNASKRGVKVYLLLESGPVGGMDKEEVALVNLLSKAGCESRFMINSPSELRFCPYPFNHAKYAILDNQSLIIHSANWDLNGIPLNPTFGNRKWGAVIENETIARYFSNLFFTDYNPLLLYSVALNETQFFNQTIELSDILDNINNVSLSGDYDPKFLAKEINGSFSLIPALSPDNSLEVLTQLIGSAEDSILIEQLYFYERLGSERNPLLEELLKTEERGVKIKVLLNFNPDYSRWGMDTNDQNQATVDFLLEHGIEARLLYTNSTSFTNLHNKAIIVDSEKVLLSSINLNANGLLKNREVGVIIQNREVANYFEGIFNYDWEIASGKGGNSLLVKVVAVGIAFLLAGGLIYRNWRKK
jgi:phosphatidylserine/phosphatidylglycerophosphate/cardiolipin synthase-like enzyme